MTRREFYQSNGYHIEEQLFSPKEVTLLREHYTKLREQGQCPLDDGDPDFFSPDPLKRYPRLMHMHRWDDTSLKWLLDERLNNVLTELLEEAPLAVQTMLYFKPPGARGQALHQDQFYLRAKPGTCIAAWMALEDSDEENGCMQVVPGSHLWPLLCVEKADTTKSFTDIQVPLKPGTSSAPMIMKAGDVLFFHGMVVHGSFPNTSKARFRRALIGHYITSQSREVGRWYFPILRMDGSVIDLEEAPFGDKCGEWEGDSVRMKEGEHHEVLHE